MRTTALLMVVALLSGCGQGNTMNYEIGQKSGNATLSLRGTTIIFEGIPAPGADIKNKATGFVLISGPGATKGQATVDGATLAYDYANGVTNLSLSDYKFKLIDNGATLVFGPQTFKVGEKDIRVAKDGTARSE